MNKYRPHILILAEDDANNDVANGFMLHHEIDLRQTMILPASGGWPKVRETLLSEYVPTLRKYAGRHMVLVVDFDEQGDRHARMTDEIPDDVADRVFVIGFWSEPEALADAGIGSRETVGLKLATECFDETRNTWEHELLTHNARELERMATQLRAILFRSC